MKEKSPIFVLSADYDGCFHCYGTISDESQHDAFKITKYLLDEFQKYEKVIMLCGSNRQDFRTDLWNESFNENGSLLEVYPNLADYLAKKTGQEVVFDSFLLADFWNKVEPGTSFREALQLRSLLRKHAARYLQYSTLPENKDKGDGLKYLFLKEIGANLGYQFFEKRMVPDAAKGLLLYIQMHYLARIFPTDEIVFEFVDDNISFILENLKQFYSNFPNLLPANVVLKLTYYKNNSFKGEQEEVPYTLAMLRGSGVVTEDLYKTASWLVEELNKVSARDVKLERGTTCNIGIAKKKYFPFATESVELDELFQSQSLIKRNFYGSHSFWQNVLWSERNESAEKRKRFDEYCGLVPFASPK